MPRIKHVFCKSFCMIGWGESCILCVSLLWVISVRGRGRKIRKIKIIGGRAKDCNRIVSLSQTQFFFFFYKLGKQRKSLSLREGSGVHMHPKSWHCQNWVDSRHFLKKVRTSFFWVEMLKHVVKWSILGNKGRLLGGNYHFLVMNYHFLMMADHFGGPSVHCGQILQKNPGKR